MRKMSLAAQPTKVITFTFISPVLVLISYISSEVHFKKLEIAKQDLMCVGIVQQGFVCFLFVSLVS